MATIRIRDLQLDIEESLAGLPSLALPAQLSGLKHLAIGDRHPQVSIRRAGTNRKVRDDAAASYFDPDVCEVVISFVPVESLYGEGPTIEPDTASPAGTDAELDLETALGQLLDQLTIAERTRPFVGLKWFRDQFLPDSGLAWARDPRVSGSLLRYATDQRLVLTSQVPNPTQPLHPVTAVRVNRKHTRFQPPSVTERKARFSPIPIKGGPISDTVLEDRR